MDEVITISFSVSEQSYNGELKAGYTKDGKVVLIGDPYYMGPVHEALCFAIDKNKNYDGSASPFSIEFQNDVDTSAECLRLALGDADKTNKQ